MGVLGSTKPDAWTLSPQLTEAPELWQGDTVVLPFWEGSGQPNIIRANGPESLDIAEGTPVWGKTLEGMSRNYGGNSFENGIVPGFFDEVEALTIAAIFIMRGENFTDNGIFGDGTKANWDNNRAVQIVSRRSERIRFFIRTNSGGYFTEDPNTNLVIGKLMVSVNTWSSADGGLLKSYLNGMEIDSVQGPTSYLPTGHGDLIVASYYDNGDRRFDADYLMCVAKTEKWSDAEVKKFSEDPFAMLRPAGF